MPLPTPQASAFPDASRRNPITLPDGTPHAGTVFLNRVIDHPNIEVGDYTYYSDFDPTDEPGAYAARLAPYLYPGAPDRLLIGRFCQIAHGVRFLTAGANHPTRGFTTFPFPVFDPARISALQPDTRDTVIGHDVWLGFGATVCPGARIGNGVIVGAGSVVRGQVPDFAVLTGNPATVARFRFAPDVISRLGELAWWDWPPDRIARATEALQAADIDALERLAP